MRECWPLTSVHGPRTFLEADFAIGQQRAVGGPRAPRPLDSVTILVHAATIENNTSPQDL
eukprot:1049847-Pyramimonas_sp.AAC.1